MTQPTAEARRAWEIISELVHAGRSPGREEVERLTELDEHGLEAVLELLELGTDEQKQGAIQVLAGLGTPKALPPIMRLLGTRPAFAQDLRPLLVRSIARLARESDQERLRPALRSFMSDASPLVRAATCDVIATLGDAALLPEVATLLDDPHRFTRDRAKACLARLAPHPPEHDATSPPSDDPPRGAHTPIEAAPHHEELDPFHALLASDLPQREAMLLRLLEDDRQIQRTARALQSGPRALRIALLEALPSGELPEDIRAVLRSRLQRTDVDTTERAMLLRRVLRQDPDCPEREAFILMHAADPDPAIRSEALVWAARSDDPRVVHLWTESLASWDPGTLLAAMRGWFSALDGPAHRRTPQALDALQRLVDQGARTPEAQLALITGLLTLERLAQQGHWLDGRASILAAQTLGHPDQRVRRVACRAILALRAHGGLPVDAAAYAPLPSMLLSTDAEERSLALHLLEGAHPATLMRHLHVLLQSLYQANEDELARACPLLARLNHPDAHQALQRLAHHPAPRVRDTARRALGA